MLVENKVGEKRATPRVPIKIPVKFRVMYDYAEMAAIAAPSHYQENAHTLDLSLEGMYLSLDQPLEVGNVIQSEIFLLDKEASVTTYAEVAWTDDEGAGIHFLLMASEERESLGDFLDKSLPG